MDIQTYIAFLWFYLLSPKVRSVIVDAMCLVLLSSTSMSSFAISGRHFVVTRHQGIKPSVNQRNDERPFFLYAAALSVTYA